MKAFSEKIERCWTFPTDLAALEIKLRQEKESAFEGPTEDKTYKELWCIYTFYTRAVAFGLIPTEQEFFQLTACDGVPDFIWHDQALEVTEATVKEDRRAITHHRGSEGMHLVGEPFSIDGKKISGGRFRAPAQGDALERALVFDIQDAIRRKSNKSYAERASLIVYPNSNASRGAVAGVAATLLEPLSSDSKLLQVFVIGPSQVIIHITTHAVRLWAKSEKQIN